MESLHNLHTTSFDTFNLSKVVVGDRCANVDNQQPATRSASSESTRTSGADVHVVQPSADGSFSCSICSLECDSLVSFKQHARSGFHQLNRRIVNSGLTAIDQDTYAALRASADGEESEQSQTSLSESDSTSTSGEIDAAATASAVDAKRLHDRLLEKNASKTEQNGENEKNVSHGMDSTLSNGSSVSGRKRSKSRNNGATLVRFVDTSTALAYAFWPVVLLPDYTTWRHDVGDKLAQIGALAWSNARSGSHRWFIAMCSGGYVAMAVFDGEKCVRHKAFQRYTVRRKQGGSQSAHDAQGGKAKSAGASMRRYNETRLREECADVLSAWRADIASCELIFLFAPNMNRSTFVRRANERPDARFASDDERLRAIPFPVRRPTFAEVVRTHRLLSRVLVETWKEAEADDLSPPSAAPAAHVSSSFDEAASETAADDTDRFHPLLDAIAQRDDSMALAELDSVLADESSQAQLRQLPLLTLSPLYAAYKHELPTVVDAIIRRASEADDRLRSLLLDARIEEQRFGTILHVLCADARSDLIKRALDAGVNPSVKDVNNQQAITRAKSKATRLMIRKFAGAHPDLWDWNDAQIVPLSAEAENEQAVRARERRKQQRKRAAERKAQQKAREAEREKERAQKEAAKADEQRRREEIIQSEKERARRLATMSEREKRALAAERRILASQGKLSSCCNPVCEQPLPSVPFERLEFKYCSTQCVREHRFMLET